MEQYTNQIADYLSNEMSSLQREAFEGLMERDAELAAEVELQKTMLKSIKARLVYKEAMDDPHTAEADRLAREAIKNRGSQIPVTKRLSTGRIILRLVAAAAILILIRLPNNITMGLSPLSGMNKRGTKNVAAYWKMLRTRLK